MNLHDPSRMTCVQCGKTQHWPDAYPNITHAVCWRCTWDDHHRHFHPPKKRLKLRSPFVREVRE